MKPFADFWNRFSIEHLWPLAVMAGIIAFLNTHPVMPHDFWWHMAIGRDILSNGAIPLTDIYSYTQPGELYPSYQQFWLMDIFLYLVYQLGGLILTILVQTMIVGSAYGLVLWLAFRRSQSWRSAALALLFAAALGFGNWNVRPQAITYLLALLILVAIEILRSGGRRGWLVLIPVVMVLWVNSHGSFPIGFAFIGIWWLEEVWAQILLRRLPDLRSSKISLATAAGLLAIIGALFNPRGLNIVSYLSTMTSNSVVQTFITEWMPPTFDTLEGSVFLFAFLGIVVLMAVSPRRAGVGQVLYFLVFGYLSLKYIRGVIWFGLVMSPFVAEQIAAILHHFGVKSPPPPSTTARQINAGFAAILGLLLMITLPMFKPLLPFTEEKAGLVGYETPIEATRYMMEHRLPGRVFHGMAFGSYLIWAAQPDYPVFVDSRIELYPPQVWNEYVQIGNGEEGWDVKLSAYGVNTLMLEPKNQAGLIRSAESSGEWLRVYSHPAVVILVRRQALSGVEQLPSGLDTLLPAPEPTWVH